MRIKLITFNARYIHSCPALFYLRSALQQALPGCHPVLHQFTVNDPYYATLTSIADGKPDVVFISTYIWNAEYVQRLLADLPAVLPRVRIIVGGPQAPYLQGREEGCTLVIGEVEGLDASFYQDLVNDRLQRRYGATTPAVFASPYRPEDFDGPLKNRHVYYESSRGCPFNCAYCLSAVVKGVRHLDLDQVFAELALILRHQPKVVRFVDRTFNDHPERALAIWEFLLAQPGATQFHFEIAPDRFTDEMFALLDRVPSGRFDFEIGIQSTHQPTLAAINRRSDSGKIAANIARLAPRDTIHLHLDLILGLPQDTRSSFQQSFNDVFQMAPHFIQMGLLKVLPGTPLSDVAQANGLINCRQPPYEVLATRWLDRDNLAALFWFGECVEAFYNTRYFPSIWRYLRAEGEDGFDFFTMLLEHCRAHGFFGQAPTQEWLSAMLAAAVHPRKDSDVIKELMLYDWLRCGHRYLPDHLETEAFAAVRNQLRRQLPLNWAGLYDYQSRDEFFRRCLFVRFSGAALKSLGLRASDVPGYVCFLPERDSGVMGLLKTMLIEHR